MTAFTFPDRYGPWAVVAGASEGIGAAFAHALAARRLKLVLIARRAEPLEALAADLRAAHGAEVRVLPLDLACEDLAARAAQACAGIEVGLLVYNAAYAPRAPFLDLPLEEHLRVLAVNCRGPATLVHTLAPGMVARGHGGVLLVSSLAGFQGSALIAHYAASKAYNRVLAEGLWDELREGGVDVVACCAGATRTPGYEATPVPKRAFDPPVLEPRQVAEEALAALGRRPSFVPGFWNRLASFFMQRLLPRRRAIIIMGNATRALDAHARARGVPALAAGKPG